MNRSTVVDIRNEFCRLLRDHRFTNVNRESTMTSLVGSLTIEIVGAGFVADAESIFGTVDRSYVEREERWYDGQSCNVNDIPGGAPAVWRAIASSDGTVNSNYGYLVFSAENGNQYDHVIAELIRNPESRRAVIIYTRPSMWKEYNVDGRQDFVCTNAVQYLIREGRLDACVQMRSNDAIMGFKNDRAWQSTMLNRIASVLGIPVGRLYWQVGSLHVYSRHFYLVDHFCHTGQTTITKERYRELYPTSLYCCAPEVV